MKARILIVDDEMDLCKGLAKLLTKDGFEVDCAFSGTDALAFLEREDYNLIYLDYMLPGIDGLEVLRRIKEMHITAPVVFMTAHGDDETGLESLKMGAREFLFKPCNTKNLRFKAFLWLMNNLVETQAIATEIPKSGNIVFRSDKMKQVLELVDAVAPSNVSVMIFGETGTGKDLIADAICKHAKNPRRAAPVAALNCAAIPESIMESELFGHAKGAFTGAVSNKEGFFETVSGGTLFLDELCSATLPLQTKLLRVLETGEYYRLGETVGRKTDVRIIAATNRDLDTEISEGRFREDLYHRICVVRIDIPPLRERREDIIPLIEHYLPEFNTENSKNVEIDRKALAAMSGYFWPGNVRELKHLVQNLVVTTRKSVIHVEDLPRRIVDNSEQHATSMAYADMKSNLDEVIDKYERDYLIDLLTTAGGNVSQAARLAGISRSYIIRKMKAHDLDRTMGIQEQE